MDSLDRSADWLSSTCFRLRWLTPLQRSHAISALSKQQSDQVVHGHRFYRLCGMSRAGRARVTVQAGERRVFVVTSSDLDEAFSKATERLDQQIDDRRLHRRGGVPTPAEIEDLLDALPRATRAKFLRLLWAHATLNGGCATGSQIAKAAGKDISHFWWVYERIGRKLGSALGARSPESSDDLVDRKAVLTFAKLERRSANEEWVITLRRSVMLALARMARREARRDSCPRTDPVAPPSRTREFVL